MNLRLFETRHWSTDYKDNFNTYWNVHNSTEFIDTNYSLGNNIFTGDIVKLTCDNYLYGTTDTTRYTDKSYILGYVRYSEDECRFRVKQFTPGNFYRYNLEQRQELLSKGLKIQAEELLPIYFYELVNGKQLFSWDKLEVVGNVYETKNNYNKELSLLSWY